MFSSIINAIIVLFTTLTKGVLVIDDVVSSAQANSERYKSDAYTKLKADIDSGLLLSDEDMDIIEHRLMKRVNKK